MRRSRSLRKKIREIAPDEIFLDSSNLPGLDISQFEGRVSRPVSRRTLAGVGVVFILIILAYSVRAYTLEVVGGASYATISRNNTLDRSLIFATRGIIYDRTGRELAWNVPQNPVATSSLVLATSTPSLYALRKYTNSTGLALLLGFVRYPKADASGQWWQEKYTGLSGVEYSFDTILAGVNGKSLTETSAHGKVERTNIIAPPVDGTDVHLSIDADLQTHLYQALVAHAHDQGFIGGSGIIMDVRTGEVLALTSFPEYDNQAFTDGNGTVIQAQSNDIYKPQLNRAISGLYTPGSIVKTIFAAAALNEQLISPTKTILSVGHITVDRKSTRLNSSHRH